MEVGAIAGHRGEDFGAVRQRLLDPRAGVAISG
jgi:hypothetical protein